MADRYWVGSPATAWTSTSAWSATDGGASGASVPTNADDVYFTALSGSGNGASAAVCRNIDFTGFTGTLTINTGQLINIWGNLTLSASMTLAGTQTGTGLNFAATTDNGGSGWSITTNGKTIPWAITFNGVGGKWQLQDALTCGSVTLTAGHWDTNNQTVSITGQWATSGATANKFLTLGSSAITCTSTVSHTGTTTVYANTATVTCAGIIAMQGSYPGTTFVVGGAAVAPYITPWGGSSTFANLTLSGASLTSVRIDAPIYLTGTFTATGINSTTSRLLVNSITLGTPVTISANAVSLTDVDFMDINLVGPTGSVITSDSFNRADGVLGTTDAAAGGTTKTWTQTAIADSFLILSNEVDYVTAGATRNVAVIDSGTSLGQYVEAKITLDPASHTTGLVVRNGSSGGLDGLSLTASGAGTLSFMVASVSQTSAGLPTFVSGQTLGLKITSGNVVQVFIDGVLIKTFDPSFFTSIPTGTYCGLASRQGADSRWDDFVAKEVPDVTGTRLGDCLGNSGITFQTPRTLYAVAPGNFSDSSMWSLSSGGTAGESPPLPQDDVYLDANSAAGTYANNLLRPCRNLDCTGFTGTFQWAAIASGQSFSPSFYGSVNLGTTGTIASAQSAVMFLRGRGTHTFGGTWGGGNLAQIGVWGPGGTYTMLNDHNCGTSLPGSSPGLSIQYGTFDTDGFDITVTSVAVGTAGNFVLHDSTVNLLHATGFGGTIWQCVGTVDADEAIFVRAANTISATTFAGGNQAYGTLRHITAGSTGLFTITGNNSFNNLEIGPAREIRFAAGSVNRIANLDATPAAQALTVADNAFKSIADSADLRLLGDFDIRFRLYMPSWNTSYISLLIKGYASQPNWYFYKHSNGWYFAGSVNGTNYTGAASNGNAFQDGLTGSTTAWVRLTRNATTGQIRCYKATDLGDNTMPSTWTDMNNSPMTSVTGNLVAPASPHPLTIGTTETGGVIAQTANYSGIVLHRLQMRNNILNDGSGIFLDIEPTSKRYMNDTVTDAYGNTMVVSGSGLVGDGRVLLRSSTTGSQATIQFTGNPEQLEQVDIQDLCFNGVDGFVGARSAIRSNVKGIRRSPKHGLTMAM